jgi:xanthine dehydrogenase YagR molybdenum-binding subunit
LDLGAERIGWAQRQPTGSQAGRLRRGLGVAVGNWGGRGHNCQVRLDIESDGEVHLFCATQDIGTGTRTAMAVCAAETFGLRPQQVTVHIGNSTYPPGGGSGGSTTIGAVSSATRTAAEAALGKLVAKLESELGPNPAQVTARDGKLTGPSGSLTWADACRRLGPETISETASTNGELMGSGTGGAQFADVEVDTETGVTRIRRMVAVQDCGLVVNKLTAESQCIGGVIMGIGYALYEQRVLDPTTGRMLNANLEFYKLPGPADVGNIEIVLMDMPERGVIGIGEPPTIPTAAAIANAVFNAIGVQVPSLPLTPDKVLMAAAGRKEA